ncbi:uncharacterized protein LOC111272927 [Varroa jacobsoni]|uniref:uncharacterized protein LOC111272927 n=1 Tax=Varroa jacobsoni TaxID=62625 RepID=UPI000BF2CA70|nr:uncharacterized protein LOC111272927 [Varroa jacobsoni]
MEGRLVIPLWHNRQVHTDLERMTKPGNICKRTPYNCANYVDVGGHGALITPSLAINPSRQYRHTLAATGPLNVLDVASTESTSRHLAFAVYEPGIELSSGRILYGGPMAGLYSHRVDAGKPSDRMPEKLSQHEHPLAVKVQNFNPDLVTVSVLSADSVSVLRGDEVVATMNVPKIDAFTSSPYIEGELAATSRGTVHIVDGEVTYQIAQQGSQESPGKTTGIRDIQDISFWTHPRHLALVSFGSLSHMDIRTNASPTKLVEPATCPYLLPKELLLSAQLNPRNVNQMFLLASDTLSVWDVRYSMQPMAVFNHYVPRSKTLFGIQVLTTVDGNFLAMVRSSERSTIFDLDPTYPAPNIGTRGLQLQFGYPMDLAYFYKDQYGEDVPTTVLQRLQQPCAGSCIIPYKKSVGTDKTGVFFNLISITTSGDWFQQRIQRLLEPEGEHAPDATYKEVTFTYGLDGPTLDDNHLEQVRSAIAFLETKEPSPKWVYNGPSRTLSLTAQSGRLCLICGSTVLVSEVTLVARVDVCEKCENVAPSLGVVWSCSGLLRHPVELTPEENATYKKLLGPNSGFAVSDEIRAVWGDVEWRVRTEDESDAGPHEDRGNEGQNEEMDHFDDYD